MDRVGLDLKLRHGLLKLRKGVSGRLAEGKHMPHSHARPITPSHGGQYGLVNQPPIKYKVHSWQLRMNRFITACFEKNYVTRPRYMIPKTQKKL
jgi:hypothetical protein